MAKTKDGKEVIAGDVVRVSAGSSINGIVQDGGAIARFEHGGKPFHLSVSRCLFVFRPESVIRTFSDGDGVYLDLLSGGRVRILKSLGGRPETGGDVIFSHVFGDGAWCSAVLAMSLFAERSGDWPRWIDHHRGRVDVFEHDRHYNHSLREHKHETR